MPITLSPEKLTKILTERAEQNLAEHKIGCAEMVVTQNGETLCHLKIGHRDITGAPLHDNAIYRIASMTKVTTATAVLQQVEAGKIDLYAPVSDYLPQFKTMMLGHASGEHLIIDAPAKNPIRVFNLLCHTNGIDVSPMAELEARYLPNTSLEDVVDFFSKMPLAFEPFTAQNYSQSGGYDVAARIVELVSGEPYPEYVRKHIFEPLGMPDTTFLPSAEQWSRFVGLHNRTADGQESEDYLPEGWVYEVGHARICRAGAGLASTASDYTKFARMLLNRGVGDNGVRVLTEESVAQLSRAWVPAEFQPGPEQWGLGVRVVTSDDYPRFLPKTTFGWSGAYGSHFWVDPVNNITAVYMRNSNYDSGGCGSIGAQFETDVMSAAE